MPVYNVRTLRWLWTTYSLIRKPDHEFIHILAKKKDEVRKDICSVDGSGSGAELR